MNQTYENCGIYKIANTINGKCYVGSAINIDKRWGEHLRALRKNKHHSICLQRAFTKYGECTFMFEVLENCLPSELISREQYYIDTLTSKYNICKTAGSSLGLKRSLEVRANLSAAGRLRCFTGGGKSGVEKPVDQYSMNGKYIASYESAVDAMRVTGAFGITGCAHGKAKSSGGYIWRFKPDGLSPLLVNGVSHGSSKPVDQYTMDGTYIASYESATEAERITGAQTISECAHGKVKFSASFVWKFSMKEN